ncbi:MAG: hypothetical protein AAGA81_22565 [Acidobacteriota bacterium]
MSDATEREDSQTTIEDLLVELLRHYRRQGHGLLAAELDTSEALENFATSASQIHAAVVASRLVHAATAAADSLNAVHQITSRLQPRFRPAELQAVLAGPPGPQLRAEIADLARDLFGRAAAAAETLDSKRWQSALQRHGGAPQLAVVDYCQRIAEKTAIGQRLPRDLHREIHLSLDRLVELRAA